MARWQCSFTYSCVNNGVGQPVRLRGTQMVMCASHAHLVELSRYTQGRVGSEQTARLELRTLTRKRQGQ